MHLITQLSKSSIFKTTDKVLRRSVSFLLLSCVVANLSACSPKLKSIIQVPDIPENMSKADRPTSEYKNYVFLDQFKDGRSAKAIANLEGKETTTASDITVAVKQAMEKAFSANQFVISESAPLTISGEVRQWAADVRGGLPSSVKSKAEIAIEVYDPAAKKIYAGTYQGNVNREESSIEEDDVRRALGTAMSEAIGQILNDRQLMNLLCSF